nr:hypothetical protein [Tanacetum cinerariifolium]
MMANLSEDIQCAGSDTRPPMFDRIDFESWQQRIRFYCLGKDNGLPDTPNGLPEPALSCSAIKCIKANAANTKDNGVNILKSIDEGLFKMGTFRELLAEGALYLGPERDRVFADLTPEENERFKADIHVMNILLQGLPKDIYTLINHYTDAKDIWDNVKMLLEGYELTKDERESQLYDEFKHFRQNKGKTIHEYYVSCPTHPILQNTPSSNQQSTPNLSNTRNQAIVQNGMVVVQNVQGRHNRGQGNYARGAVAAGIGRVQNRENEAVLDEEQLLFIVGGQTNTFDDDVDEALVHDLALNEDNVFQSDQCDAFDYDVDEASTAQTINIIPYEQYVKDNAVQVA